jgi:hypothetical protein
MTRFRRIGGSYLARCIRSHVPYRSPRSDFCQLSNKCVASVHGIPDEVDDCAVIADGMAVVGLGLIIAVFAGLIRPRCMTASGPPAQLVG